MSNIEIPSDNPSFRENTSHINTSILKPDINDMLHLSKIDELETKFDALKSLATREISNLTNKEKRDVSNSKLLHDNFEFIRKEILSKDKLINYLMGTQTTILNLATSAKNQEKTHEKLQKFDVPQQQQQYLNSTFTTTFFTQTERLLKSTTF